MSKIISSLKEIFSTGGMVILGLVPYCYIFVMIPGIAFLKKCKLILNNKETT